MAREAHLRGAEPGEDGGDVTTFFVPGVPRPKARPRVVAGHAYTPATTREWEMVVRAHYQGPLYEGPVGVTMVFQMPTRRRVDLDNLCKAVMDALNGKAWNDDGQVMALGARKVLGCDEPGVWVTVEEETR